MSQRKHWNLHSPNKHSLRSQYSFLFVLKFPLSQPFQRLCFFIPVSYRLDGNHHHLHVFTLISQQLVHCKGIRESWPHALPHAGLAHQGDWPCHISSRRLRGTWFWAKNKHKAFFVGCGGTGLRCSFQEVTHWHRVALVFVFVTTPKRVERACWCTRGTARRILKRSSKGNIAGAMSHVPGPCQWCTSTLARTSPEPDVCCLRLTVGQPEQSLVHSVRQIWVEAKLDKPDPVIWPKGMRNRGRMQFKTRRARFVPATCWSKIVFLQNALDCLLLPAPSLAPSQLRMNKRCLACCSECFFPAQLAAQRTRFNFQCDLWQSTTGVGVKL